MDQSKDTGGYKLSRTQALQKSLCEDREEDTDVVPEESTKVCPEEDTSSRGRLMGCMGGNGREL